MEKVLKLYTFVDGVNDTPFPNSSNQAQLGAFRYNAKRMGSVFPTIEGTLMYPKCLDNELQGKRIYVTFNGEKYFLKQTPTNSYSNDDVRYKHELVFESQRAILGTTYFYDVVAKGEELENDKPVSNSSKFDFYGDIHQFVKRLNYSLQYSNVGYSVVIDSGIGSDNKFLSFEDSYFINVLQEAYNEYDIPYYFVGNTIHFGYSQNVINNTFKVGINDALLSIRKNNANTKIINRITGIGSSENIPYYYPNEDEKGQVDVLYNNESNLVNIFSRVRFKKVKLSDRFNYYDTPAHQDILNDNNYSHDGQMVEIGVGSWYIGGIEYTFDISNNLDTNFVLTYEGDNYNNDDVSITLYKGDVDIERGMPLGNFSRKYNAGTYRLVINLTVNDVLEPNFDKIISHLGVYIYQDVPPFVGWVLNDNKNKAINLDDYGLSVVNTPEDGDIITFEQLSYIIPQLNLMPPIYRESNASERFYNALDNTYKNDKGEYYDFENPYSVGNPKEHKQTFEDIKPSIKGMVNASGQRIDMFSEFAYDTNDNDEFDEEGNYIHPYFFGKLRKFDGDYGFNLFEHTIEKGSMTISMTSGSCGACNFEIGVDENTQKNIVQVDDNGNLKRDNNGNVIRSGSPQARQNDTQNYEVWVALKKDIETFGVVMPNATYNYKPSANDTFVIINIDLPQSYILSAENQLKDAIIKYMYENNSEKFNFSISFSRIYFEENPTILADLNENSEIKIEYNGKVYELFISDYSYTMTDDKPLPEIKIELYDSLEIKKNIIQSLQSNITTLQTTKANKSSSLKGYGIQDAKISSTGVVQIGKKSVEPITQHQDLQTLTLQIKGIDIGTYNPNIRTTINIQDVGINEDKVNALIKNYVDKAFEIQFDESGNVTTIIAKTNLYSRGGLTARYQGGESGGSGGGASNLWELNDVTITNPTNGQSLVYRNGVWVNEVISGGVSGDYLPLSGGTIDSTNSVPVIINTSNSTEVVLQLSQNGQLRTIAGYDIYNGSYIQNGINNRFMGIADDGTPYYHNGSYKDTLIHSGNIGSYNAGSATKLQTTRTIWGQSFDGTGDVNGRVLIFDSNRQSLNSTYIADSALLHLSSLATNNDGLFFGHMSNSTSWIQSAFYGTSANPSSNHTYPISLNPLGGNVLIGTTTNSGAKLQVQGDCLINGRNYNTISSTSDNLAHYGYDNGGIIGTIKITLPNSWDSDMSMFEIWVYEYNSMAGSKVFVSGHSYSGSYWYYMKYAVLGNYNKGVRLAHDGSKLCILLGNTSSYWEYPQIYLKARSHGLTGREYIHSSGYSISLITDESSFSTIQGVDISDTYTNHIIATRLSIDASYGVSPTAQGIVINTTNNANDYGWNPGIGFHIPGVTYGTIKLTNDSLFRFFNSSLTGYFGIVTGEIYAYGNIYANGGITAKYASDARLKEDVKTITTEVALATIMALNPITFKWNSKATELCSWLNGESQGFIAQEYEALIPNSGSEMWGEYRGIDYNRAIPYIVAVEQNHEQRIKQLEEELQTLKRECYGLH